MERIKLFLCKTFTWIKLGIQVVEGFLNLKTLFWLERRVWNFKLLFRLFSTSTGWQAHFKLGNKTTKQWEWWDFVSILSWASKNQKALNGFVFLCQYLPKVLWVYLSSKNICVEIFLWSCCSFVKDCPGVVYIGYFYLQSLLLQKSSTADL